MAPKLRGPLLVAAAIFALLLAACNPSGAATTAPTAAPSTAPASAVAGASQAPSVAPTPAQPVTLTWYSALNETEPYVAAYKQIIASYEALHPNVTINVTWMGRQLSTKIRPLLQSGTKPDIIEDDLQIMYAGLRKDGLVADLTPYLAQPGYNTTDTWKSQWTTGSLELLSSPGQLTTLPFWVNGTQVFYDQRTFDKYNFSVPTTWDQLMTMCATLKAANQPCFGEEGGFADYNMYWLSELSDRLMNGTALLQAATDKTGQMWLQPGFLTAAQDEASLKSSGYLPKGFEGSQYPAAQIAWVNGKSAFYLLSDWLPSELVDKTPTGFAFKSFPFPTVGGQGSPTDVEMYQWGFSLFKDSAHPQEAIDFMKYFTSADIFKPLQTDYAFVSGIKTTFTPKDNADSQANIDAATAVHGYAGGLVAQAPDYLSSVLEPLNDKLIFNTITPEQFISQISQKTIDYWKTH
jgi:ABC-type glycerol-3-phosphate transport system substrate-binding protein